MVQTCAECVKTYVWVKEGVGFLTKLIAASFSCFVLFVLSWYIWESAEVETARQDAVLIVLLTLGIVGGIALVLWIVRRFGRDWRKKVLTSEGDHRHMPSGYSYPEMGY